MRRIWNKVLRSVSAAKDFLQKAHSAQKVILVKIGKAAPKVR